MSNDIHPELSKKSKYWISKHRYYELRHFCFQYHEYVAAANDLYLRSKSVLDCSSQTESDYRPVEDRANDISVLTSKIRMIKDCAAQADPVLGSYIFKAVTRNMSFEMLKAQYDIPCERDMYYDRYRKFYWLLSNRRI